MTKSQLIERIARKQSLLGGRDVELAVKTMLEHLASCLAAGGRVEIRGFGSFSLRFPSRAGRPQPQDRSAGVASSENTSPYFKPGKVLRERVDRLPPGTRGDSGGG